MRNMSFKLTTEQFKNQTKTVTRRLGWNFLQEGDRIMGCEQCQGIKAGTLNRLGEIEIVSVRKEQLSFISSKDVALEGFPNMTTDEFITMFCGHMKCTAWTEVTRIEFRYLDKPTEE